MDPGPALSPRAARTRAALVAAGFDLLAERPIDAIPIDAVVARAGVAKGSFFNHFADKPAFAAALAREVRGEVEALVARANHGVTDPIARIAGGMRVVAGFARDQPKRAAVLLRNAVTDLDHPLNQGLVADFAAAADLLRPEAVSGGVLYWLGLCQVLMQHLVECPGDRVYAARRLHEMTLLGLVGIGADPAQAADLADAAAAAIGR